MFPFLVLPSPSPQTHYSFLVQKLRLDLDALLLKTRDPKIPIDQQQPLHRQRVDGCMEIMKKLGQGQRQPRATEDVMSARALTPSPVVCCSFPSCLLS